MTNPQDLAQSEIDRLDAEAYAEFLSEGDPELPDFTFLTDEEWEAYLRSHQEFDL